jgi:tRNA threonylcarbamoyl adenosine modification protein YeaZ
VLLAVDTSGATSVAVVDATGALLAEAVSDDPRGHAEAIGPLLARVLAETGRDGIEAVAYGVGPGPYTGLRVGMAAARAAALALAVPELPVLSHDAAALAELEAGGALPFVVVADAKRRERYWTPYRRLDAAGTPTRDAEPQVGAEADVPALRWVEVPVHAGVLGRIAALRAAAGVTPEPQAARYLRSPDVTLSTPKRVAS